MGKGDKKTARGKRAMGSYGVTRKRKEDKVVIVPKEKKAKKAETETAKPAAKNRQQRNRQRRNRQRRKPQLKNLNKKKLSYDSFFFNKILQSITLNIVCKK